MSISRSILGRLLDTGRLHERPSNFTGYETVRTVYAVPDIIGVTSGPFGESLRDERLAEFAQALDAFSEGGRFSVAQDPRSKPGHAMLARIEPASAEFWCIRVTAPEETPGIRAFGAFVEKDVFVILAWHYREEMSFDEDVTLVRKAWRELFGDATPHGGKSLDQYVTNYWEV
jgi:hypothetical protein